TLVAGRSRLEQDSEPGETDEVNDGRNSAQLVNLGWRFTPSKRFTLGERVAFAANRSRNENVLGAEFDHGSGHDLTWRTDFTATPTATLVVEGGGQVQRQQRALAVNDLDG